jgi:hypothetical protein
MALGDVLIARLNQMAVHAGDIGIGVAALGPVTKNTGCRHFVTLDTGLGLRRDAALDPILLDLGIVGLLGQGGGCRQPDSQQTDG